MASKEVEESEEASPTAPVSKKNDTELSTLLDEALEDFEKYDIGEKTTKEANRNDKETANEAPNEEGTAPHPMLAECLESHEFQKLAEEFTKALDGMPEEDLDALQNFGRMVLTENFASGDVKPAEMEDSLSRAFDALKQNMKDVEGHGDRDFDSHLLDSIKNIGLEGGDEEGFFEMMQGFMKELLSKEVIYPSLKEMAAQYPTWLEENKAVLSDGDYQRYKTQHDIIAKLCKSFEMESDQETEAERKARFDNNLVLIQKMQKCGQPPNDLMTKVMKDTGEGDLGGAAGGPDCSVM